ncbi:MAG: hypothetical protein ACYTEX_17370 [Planctomycetota bacterium]
MKTMMRFLTAGVLVVVAGCAGPEADKTPLGKNRELLTVDFQPDQSLRYKFVSSRKMIMDWSAGQKAGKKAQDSIDESSEQVDIVCKYTPVEVEPYGLTTVKATIESLKARRTSRRGNQLRDAKDAVKSLAGKSFMIKVSPTGAIKDASQLEQLIKQAGEKAFRSNTRHGRIKEPDMIGDFIASQWFLWDAASSIEKPKQGITVGQTWKSQLSLPTPMVMREARDVDYTFDEIRETDKGRIAVITSSFSHAPAITNNWPNPYPAGSFQVSGRFGLLRRFEIHDFQGQGQELFNIDKGRIEQYKHQHQMKISATLLMPLPGANPQVTIDQTLTMTLLEN